ncbi:uncharacterized, partial [Tachysurus ichikawai]
MLALVGDAGEVRRAGRCRRGAVRRQIGAGRSVRVRDQRMQPLISLLLALTHLLMELHGSDIAVYLLHPRQTSSKLTKQIGSKLASGPNFWSQQE